ncbi:chromosomal replication initiator protein DnaA [Actinobaculum sp. 313]|uniref:chromosomal replication initiator protein DnaA n=1 Tax=Actinobaculum sp. 313 TaxID=2495645 RepID=UPI000D529142|nr:chromosomal replication initiator protein DnaA [Actinobaculum sp. 313]AWE41415.1 chromosomal replication initiator protein DnaA [Actinobaculum sp. 313]
MGDGNPARDAWTAAAELLRTEGLLSDSQIAFVRMAHPLAAVDEIFMIAVGSDFVKTWIEEHVATAMTARLSDILGREIRLMISVDPSVNETPAPSASSAPVTPSSPVRVAGGETASLLTTPAAPVHQPPVTSPTLESPQSPIPPVVSAPVATSAPASTGTTAMAESLVQKKLSPIDTLVEHNPTLTGSISTISTTAAIATDVANPSSRSIAARLNPRYTFSNFVIGDSNRFATATALAVAESPGTTYNPLFLYSESGMGKTHLMHAIGNYALNLYPHIKVRYISAEEFTNDFINSLRDGRQAEFKDQFRTVDILLIDDIQFIGGRDTTVEEFFHTFNALTNANKQIVITSDVAPNLLNGFEERMVSRFISGVTASIDRPSLETSVAILEKKASVDGIQVPREVHEYIAANMTTNIREMEGALRRVTAFADLSKQPVDLTLSEMVLKDLISNPDDIEITASLIMSQTANYFEITIDDLTAADRSRTIVTARQIAMYLCREMTDLSLPRIGNIFGRRDHTTVMHAYRKIDKQMAERQTTYNQVSELTSRIKQAAASQQSHSEQPE